MILSAQELRLIARDMLRLLPERATVERASETTDRYGVVQHTYTTVATDVPCRVAPVETGYDPTREQMKLRGDVTIVLLRDVDVRVGDIVVLGSRRYRVVETKEIGTIGFLRRVAAEVVR
jgi:hypothetical protein